jgi:hypothetical protein
MTRNTNARLAGVAFLLYIVSGIASMVVFRRATSGAGIAAKLASIAQHTTEVRVHIFLVLLGCFSAVVLGVTLFALTREQDPDVAMIGMACRVIEGANSAIGLSSTYALLWLVTATGPNAPDAAGAQALGAFLMTGDATVSALFFAVGSTLFSWLLLRGRMIPIPLAWLGVVASLLLVIVLPVKGAAFPGVFGWLMWMPMLVFEVTLAVWWLIKGDLRRQV